MERGDKPALDRETIRRLEWYEMSCWPTWYAAATRQIEVAFGLRLTEVEGAQVAIATRLDCLLFNRVLGLGNEQPTTAPTIDRIIAMYQAAGVPRFFIQVSPAAEPGELRAWLGARGFTRIDPWAKLHRATDRIPAVDAPAEIGEIAPEDGPATATFGAIVQTAFEYPPETAAWFASLVGRPGWRHYLAAHDGSMVGAAALYQSGDWASLEIGVVLPEARNRGIHSALIVRRMRDAAAAGCRLLTMETLAETPGERAQSFRNARRLGFALAYFRENWEWRASPREA